MIKLDENYTIEPDIYSLVLQYRKENEPEEGKDKGTVTEKQTYHTTFSDAIKKYTDNCLKDCKTVVELGIKVGELNERIDRIFKDVKRIKPVKAIEQEVED